MAEKPEPVGHVNRRPYNAWQSWVTKQNDLWVDNEGLVYLIKDIDCEYALNILKFLWRNHKVDLGVVSENPLVLALRDQVLAKCQPSLTTGSLDIELIAELTLALPT